MPCTASPYNTSTDKPFRENLLLEEHRNQVLLCPTAPPSMDDPSHHQLLYRNGQLEAELRLVKEQLAQANIANQYLLSRLATPPTDPYAEEKARLQEHYDQAIRDNVRLNAQLGVTPRITSKARLGKRTIEYRRKDSGISIPETTVSDTDDAEDDLLSFDEDESPVTHSNLRPQPEVTFQGPKKADKKRDTIGVGVANTVPTETGGKRHGFEIKYSDGTSSFVPTPDSTPDSSFASTPFGAPASRYEALEEAKEFHRSVVNHQHLAPLPFTDGEHRRMMGMACFLEDMTPGKKAEIWHQHAIQNQRHSSHEYEQYYEEVIRPAYLEKMKARTAASEDGVVVSHIEGDQERDIGTSDEESPLLQKTKTESEESLVPPFENPEPAVTQSNGPLRETDPASQGSFPSTSVVTQVHGGPDISPVEEVEPAPVLRNDPKQVIDTALQEYTSSKSAVSEELRNATSRPSNQLALSRHADPNAFLDENDATSPLHPGPLQTCFHLRPRHDHRQCHSQNPGPRGIHEIFTTTYPDDPHAYRTVIISNITPGTRLVDLLSTIHSGRIFSATLHDTAGFRTTPPLTTNTATIIFVSGSDAQNLLNKCAEDIANLPFPEANVKLLETVTRPIPAWVMTQLREQNLSRVLCINAHGKTWSLHQVVEQLLRQGVRKPLKEKYDEVQGLITLEFASIFEAKMAFDVVGRDWRFFESVERGYVVDPCEVV